MKKQVLWAALFLFASTQLLVAQNSTILKEKSSISFKIKNAGFWVNGSFSDFEISGLFNSDQASSNHLEGILQVKSINTNNKKRDKHLISEDFFEAEKYPEVKIINGKITSQGDGYLLNGNLQIKETTKAISIPFLSTNDTDHHLLTGTLELDRVDFGVGGKSWLMNRKVFLTFEVAIKK